MVSEMNAMGSHCLGVWETSFVSSHDARDHPIPMSVSLPPPPSPSHILRIHAASVTHVSFSADNSRLYSGDVLGNVNVTTTRSLRPIASWKAHSDGILGIQEWTNTIITFVLFKMNLLESLLT